MTASTTVAASETLRAIAACRPYLLRVARSKVSDGTLAEEAVQETLLAGIQSAARFAGRSTVRTWLTGILLHKIQDAYRDLARSRIAPGVDPDDDPFDENGAWREAPVAWSDPERALESRRFRDAFIASLATLPTHQAEAFMLREIAGLDAKQVCATMGISQANLWVLLHRARLRLRAALARDWFASPQAA